MLQLELKENIKMPVTGTVPVDVPEKLSDLDLDAGGKKIENLGLGDTPDDAMRRSEKTAFDQDLNTTDNVEFSEVRLTPKALSAGPEGTIFYCSDDNSVYVGVE